GQPAAKKKAPACHPALTRAVHKRSTLQKTIATEEQRQRDLSVRLRRLSGVLAQVTLLETQQRELARQETELARLPADVDTVLARVQAEHDELAELAQVVPQLARLAQARDDLRAARTRERQAAQAEQTIKARGA